ncbi:MAG: VUT family protein [Treponemataceae bacterium]|nr:VUT family protein [Treponemataceae bacterium]
MKGSFGSWLKSELMDYKILLRNIPSLTISIFILSVVCANLMANKELISYKYVALDCGFIFSWLMFLCMDVICKRWGAKASIKVSLLALLVNLAVCGIFALLSLAPGKWGEFYGYEDEAMALAVNTSLNSTFGGAWYVVFGSALAFIVSSIINALLNVSIAKIFSKSGRTKGFGEFAGRSYVSTMIAQLVDNLIFATVVSKFFFGWTWTQVLVCSAIGAVAELLAEVFFSGFGYKIVTRWEKENVGQQYFEYLAEKK